MNEYIVYTVEIKFLGRGGYMRLIMIGLILFMLSTLLVMEAAPEDTRFSGGGFDGYDKRLVINTNFPSSPPSGTVITIR